jgi:hypothetical protein
MSGSRIDSLFMTSVFLVVLAFFNYNFFSDLWFPDLYVFPFAAASVSLARLASGRTDSLVALAISAGFLTNGHVSFIPTLGIMLLICVAANFVGYLRVPERRILGATFFRIHRQRITIGVAVLALFFVPLCIETIVAYPGPIVGYVNYKGDRIVHPLRESSFFVADFWGGLAPLIGSLAAAALAVGASRLVPPLRARIVPLLVVLTGSTIALFIYARYGIDYLVLNYVGYYYYTTPTLLFAVVAFVALKTGVGPLPTPRSRQVAVAVACVCLFGTYWKIHRPVRDVDQYNQPGVVKLYDAIKGAATDGRIVLDLDNRQDWGWLWTNLVGAEALALRHHENLFCLNKNFHILFTDTARCTPDEVRSRPRYTVRVERGPRSTPVAFEALDIVFSRYALPDITDAGPLRVNQVANQFNDYFLASGWSPPEGEHVWSSGVESHLAFRLRPGFAGVVALDCGAFLVPGHTRVTGQVFVNDVPAGRFEFTTEKQRQMLVYPVSGGDVDIKILVDNPTSPKAVHAGDDPRVLGISLFGMEVRAS